MAQYSAVTKTVKGVALMAKAGARVAPLDIREALASDYEYPPGTDWAALASLGGVRQRAPAAVSYADPATIRAGAAFSNAGLAAGYSARAVGLEAYDSDSGETILFAVAHAVSSPDFMPPASAGAANMPFVFEFPVSAEAEIALNVSHAALATLRDVQDARDAAGAALEAHIGDGGGVPRHVVWCGAAAPAGGTYALDTGRGYASLADGMAFAFRASASADAAMIKIDGLAAVAVMKGDGAAPARVGEGIVTVRYVGGSFFLASGGGEYGTATGAD
ncbi:MAG: hypothetical protein LBJ10_08255, partial [Clostridiales bacterium]|nr:hypothetical protein [Clostridiales bacterium]